MGNIFQNIEDWFWKKELASVAKKIILVAISFIAAHNVLPILATNGIKIEIDQNQATLALFGGFEYLRNYLRKQYKIWWL